MEHRSKYISMDRALEAFDSKFRFVLLASTRAQQLVRGARPHIELVGTPARVAMEELKAGFVPWSYGPPPEDQPEIEDGESPAEETEEATGDELEN